MRTLRYSINLTLDGCCDHNAVAADEELHHFHAGSLARADALILGRVIYQMMEEAWRRPAETGQLPDWMADWMLPFARIIHAAKKYVVSDSLQQVDWNAELVRGADLAATVKELKAQPGRGLFTSGLTLPKALAELGLIDEYELVVHPRLAGHGPSLLAGLSHGIDLRLIGRRELSSGAQVLHYALRDPRS